MDSDVTTSSDADSASPDEEPGEPAKMLPTGWTDGEDEDDNSGVDSKASEPTMEHPKTKCPSRSDLRKEFKEVYENYGMRCSSLNWERMLPDTKAKPSSNGVVSKDELMKTWKLDIGLVFKVLNAEDPKEILYGFLPYMATTSRGSLGAFLASNFAERINSTANIVLHDGNLKLSEDELSPFGFGGLETQVSKRVSTRRQSTHVVWPHPFQLLH